MSASITPAGGSTSVEVIQDGVATALTNTSSLAFTYDDPGNKITAAVVPSGVDHNSLANLTASDPHSQYPLLAGRATGQTIKGGTAAADPLVLSSTSHASKGFVLLNDTTGLAVDADPTDPICPALFGNNLNEGMVIISCTPSAGFLALAATQGVGTNSVHWSCADTAAEPTQLLNGGAIATLNFNTYAGGDDYTNQMLVATMVVAADEDLSPTALGGSIQFQTVDKGTINVRQRLVLDSLGQINIPSASGANLNWTTDGAGDIGSPDGGTTSQRPRHVFASGNIRAAGSLGVGNAADASVIPVANLVKKIEVFDASGTSLGYVPVYSSIT